MKLGILSNFIRFKRFADSRHAPSGNDRNEESGLWGEEHAECALRSKGYVILGRRLRVGRHDEIDLIARDGDTLVFIEVKTRASEVYGRPFEFVNRKKKHALSRAAVRYMSKLNQSPEYYRFDIVEVLGSPGDEDPEIDHIECAFEMDKRYFFRY